MGKMNLELVAAQEDLEKLRPLIDDPEPTTPIKTNGTRKGVKLMDLSVFDGGSGTEYISYKAQETPH